MKQLDPKVPTDGHQIAVGGYTNLGIYLNGLASR
jgi:hypothetical protein